MYVRFLLFLTAGIFSGCGSSDKESLTQKQSFTATSEVIAKANLFSQIKNLEAKKDRTTSETKTLLGLYQASIRYYGKFENLESIEKLGDEVLKSRENDPEALLIAADVKSSLHYFDEANEYLDKAESLGSDAKQIESLRLVLWQAKGEKLKEVLEIREQKAEAYPSLENFGLLAAIQAELGLYKKADSSFQKALEVYSDVSPYAYAWIYFQRGILWGETAEPSDASLAENFYKEALSFLPTYVQASVHYSETILESGNKSRALNTLNPTLKAGDPEGLGFKGEMLKDKALIAEADTKYRSLLKKFELAVADHATEFYMGPGEDANLAQQLALKNLANRKTFRAYSLAIEALINNHKEAEACEVYKESLKIANESPRFALLAELVPKCD